MEPLESCFSYRAKNNWWQMMVGGETASILPLFPIHLSTYGQKSAIHESFSFLLLSHPPGVAHHRFVTPGAPFRALKRQKTLPRQLDLAETFFFMG